VRTSRRTPRVVVTAGPTREAIDDVRFLSNASTGRMGIEIARDLARRGASVVLVLGPTTESPPTGLETHRVTSTREMLAVTRRAARGADLVVFAAAPADWRPASRVRGKIAKRRVPGPRTLRLVETPDVAATLGRRKGARVHVGFALEVANALENAREKMARKSFDAVVLNGPRNVGPGGGAVWWIEGAARPVRIDRGGKRATAKAVAARSWALLELRRRAR